MTETIVERKHPLAECEVPLTNSSKVALVDREDLEKVLRRTWYLTPEGYAKATDHRDERYLHKFVFPVDPSLEVDHINNIRLDCRRSNLQEVTRSTNAQRKPPTGEVKYKGVFKHYNWSGTIKYVVQITKDYQTRCLGTFETAEDAAEAYDAAAKELHGNKARTNF